MIPYNVRIPQATLGATTAAIGTIIAAAARSLLITEFDFEGMGNASASNEIGLYRVGTAGVTGSGALTFTPVVAPSTAPTFQGTGFASYSTQPIAGALIQNMPLNANGQRYYWKCNPNLNNAISVPGGNNAAASVALFPISGSSSVAGRIQLNEL
jgi:hypothetical protein